MTIEYLPFTQVKEHHNLHQSVVLQRPANLNPNEAFCIAKDQSAQSYKFCEHTKLRLSDAETGTLLAVKGSF